ncbi:MAG: zinc ribbon domain-containing protein [Polyangiaceae bacterium]
MKIQSEIEALERLAALDAILAEVGEQLGVERGALEEKRGRQSELEARIERDRGVMTDMERQRGESLQEMRQMTVQVERSREKMARCRTEREANAVQRELEELRKLQRDREVEIQKLDALHDQAAADIAETEAKLAEIAGELGASEGEVTTKLAELEKIQTEKKIERETVIKAVKPQMYRKYELIRQRRGSGIAHTTDGKCSECHIMLLPMMFQTLRRGESFDQCPSCLRIIYFKPPSAPGAEGDGEAETEA